VRLRRQAVASPARPRPGALPGPDREVLVLRHVEQLALAEIAAVLGVTEGTAGRRHLRALERLRALLGACRSENEP